jgi:hypothetical protein
MCEKYKQELVCDLIVLELLKLRWILKYINGWKEDKDFDIIFEGDLDEDALKQHMVIICSDIVGKGKLLYREFRDIFEARNTFDDICEYVFRLDVAAGLYQVDERIGVIMNTN